MSQNMSDIPHNWQYTLPNGAETHHDVLIFFFLGDRGFCLAELNIDINVIGIEEHQVLNRFRDDRCELMTFSCHQ